MTGWYANEDVHKLYEILQTSINSILLFFNFATAMDGETANSRDGVWLGWGIGKWKYSMAMTRRSRLATDLLMRSRRLARAYLECGSSSGEPIAIGPGVDGMLEDEADAAASGCKKFRLWSIRSWCCVKHLVSNSGSASIRSCDSRKRTEIAC